MLPVLIDKNLPWRVAVAFRAVEYTAHAVGYDDEAPAGNSPDDEICAWCKAHGNAILLTTDRGKKDVEMIVALRKHEAHALFLYSDLRAAPADVILLAILNAGHKVDLECRKRTLHHRLKKSGRIEPR